MLLQPLSSTQWTIETAAHLLNRAGFGGTPAMIRSLWQLGLDGAVRSLLDYPNTPDTTPLPEAATPDEAEADRRNAIRNAADPEMKKALFKEEAQILGRRMVDLRYWWLRRMALGPQPLQEKMTLFWHGHFATSFEKVRNPYYLWRQNQTFRNFAKAKFADLLIVVAKDPAMLVYLDGARSRAGKPNENFAREVMELFTLGEGHYTEHDIGESARAYTGWGLTRDRLTSTFYPRNHDYGDKTFLGKTGNLSGEDALRLIAQQPTCARFIAEKLWRYFAQDPVPAAQGDALASEFSNHELDVHHLLNIIFRSEDFYAPSVVRSQIKSPVQWLISSVLQLQTPLPPAPTSLVMLAQLGQELFQPPNVKGWDGGIAWVTTNSLLDRYNFAAELVEGPAVQLPALRNRARGIAHFLNDSEILTEVPPSPVNGFFSGEELADPKLFVTALSQRFLQGGLQPHNREMLEKFATAKTPLQENDIRNAIRLLMSTPEYQLT